MLTATICSCVMMPCTERTWQYLRSTGTDRLWPHAFVRKKLRPPHAPLVPVKPYRTQQTASCPTLSSCNCYDEVTCMAGVESSKGVSADQGQAVHQQQPSGPPHLLALQEEQPLQQSSSSPQTCKHIMRSDDGRCDCHLGNEAVWLSKSNCARPQAMAIIDGLTCWI